MSSQADQAYETIKAELIEDGTVLRLTLNQPKANVLSRAMLNELSDALEAHQDLKQLRLVFLRGAGSHFSFGASVEEHRREQAPGMLSTFHGFVRRLAAFPVPVAALVQGSCLGGGFEVVLCCHFVFATESARFGCPEIKLGVLPPVLAAVGSARLGGPTAERLLLTGDTLDARNALGFGFVTELFEEDADPEDKLLTWYRGSLRTLSAFSLREGTKALRETSGFLADLDRTIAATERQYVENILSSHDGNEGIESFLEKRKPEWKDE